MSQFNAVERLESIGFEPVGRPDLAPIKIKVPMDWGLDPFQDENWLFQLHTLRWLRPYISMYEKTKDISYLKSAFDVLNDWHSSGAKPQKVVWGDMATGIRSEVLYEFHNSLLNEELLSSQLDVVVGMVKEHYSKLIKPGFINVRHNHALFALHGLKSLNRIVNDDLADAYIEKTFSVLLDRQFDENGVHTEHSPHYHFFITAMIEKYISTGWYSEMPMVLERLSLYKENRNAFLCHRGLELPFGDTDNNSTPLRFSVPKEHPGHFLFCKSGYAVLRGRLGASKFTVALTNNNNSHTHYHADNLSLVWFLENHELLVDPGKYSYNSKDAGRKKVLSPRHHNTIVVDDFEWGYADTVPGETFVERVDEKGVYKILSSLRWTPKRREDGKEIILSREVVTDGRLFMQIVDKVIGEHDKAEGHLYFHPESSLVRRKEGYSLSVGDRRVVISFENGGEGCISEIVQGVYSPQYGRLVDTPGIKYKFVDQAVVNIFVEDSDHE